MCSEPTFAHGDRIEITGRFLTGAAGTIIGRYLMSNTVDGDEWTVRLDGKSRTTAVRGADMRKVGQ